MYASYDNECAENGFLWGELRKQIVVSRFLAYN